MRHMAWITLLSTAASVLASTPTSQPASRPATSPAATSRPAAAQDAVRFLTALNAKTSKMTSLQADKANAAAQGTLLTAKVLIIDVSDPSGKNAKGCVVQGTFGNNASFHIACSVDETTDKIMALSPGQTITIEGMLQQAFVYTSGNEPPHNMDVKLEHCRLVDVSARKPSQAAPRGNAP